MYQSRFEVTQEDFENQLDLLGHMTTSFENSLDKIQSLGYLGGIQYYEALRNVESQNIDLMKQELADLTQAMSDAVNSGTIEENSSAWYSMQSSINEVKEAIQEAELATIEYGNSAREALWGIFDYVQDRISTITSESEFLIELMSNEKLFEDNGQLTDMGTATMGLHGQNYNVYMQQADEYAKELEKITALLMDDPANTKLIERREELLELQQQSIESAQSERQAIVEMVEQGIELELDALQKLIDKRKENLAAAKD